MRNSLSQTRQSKRKPFLGVELLEGRDVPATFTVTTLGDGNAGSLRDAIDLANAAPDADTIVFAPSVRGGTVGLSILQNFSISVPKVPQPAGPSALIVTSPVTIQGTGETITRLGSRDLRLFQVTAAGNLTLQNLTLRDGRAVGGAGGGGGGGAAGLGGAIYNQGALTILGCTLLSNQAIGGTSVGGIGGGGGGLGGPNNNNQGGPPNGAGIALFGGFGGGGGAGGGGGGFGGGGGGGGPAGFSNGGFGGGGGGNGLPGTGGNGGPGGFGGAGAPNGYGGGSGLGGAVFNQGGTVAISNSTITTNTARGGDASGTGQNGGGYGGGVFNSNGTLTLTNVTIAGNFVQAGSGGRPTRPTAGPCTTPR